VKTMTRAMLLTLPLIGACVSAPPRIEPTADVEIPERWTGGATEPSPVVTEWWDTFEDPYLSELVRSAQERNHDLRAAAARLDRAAAEARIAGADLKPAIGVGLTAGRQKFNGAAFGGNFPSSTFTNYGVSLDVSWEVDLWGRLRAGARAAVADFQATEAELRGARLSIAGQTAKAWFAVVEARQQAVLARRAADRFRASSNLVRSRFESGIRPALDLRLALASLATAEALTERREEQLARATRQLEVLLGRYPDGTTVENYAMDALPPTPPPIPAGLPAEIIARRPDLVAAERRLAAADQRYLASRRALYPRLTLTGSGGATSVALGDLLDGDFGVWSLVGGLTQPLFQGGKLRGGVDRADAVSQEAIETYASRVLGAYAEVESALAAESFLAEQERLLDEASTQLIAATNLAEDRYRSGLGIYLVVLDSQTRALNSLIELLAVRRQRLNNRVDLHLALGGGFEPVPTEPPDSPSTLASKEIEPR